MGGSILNSRRKNQPGFQTRAWVRILLAGPSTIPKQAIRNKMVPRSWYPMMILGSIDIMDPSLVITKPLSLLFLLLLNSVPVTYPSYILGVNSLSDCTSAATVWIYLISSYSIQFVKLLRLKEVYHFHDMIEMLLRLGYEKGTTLFGYGYDFRQSNRVDKLIEGLRVKLETAYRVSGGRKVDVISHSMGGLLVSCFLSLHNDVFAKLVIACPFQGAPGCINDSLLTGLQFVEGLESYFFVSRWAMHQLLVKCPSIYEMLANPEFKWDKRPKIQVWRSSSAEDGNVHVDLETYGPDECVSVFEAALRNNELNYDGRRISLPFNSSILRWAAQTRRIINNAELPSGASTMSTGHPLTHRSTYATVPRHLQ